MVLLLQKQQIGDVEHAVVVDVGAECPARIEAREAGQRSLQQQQVAHVDLGVSVDVALRERQAVVERGAVDIVIDAVAVGVD